jgi:NAD(P)-dependent dehydrogenase (short-subunit alcohol dehydrogenase family)
MNISIPATDPETFVPGRFAGLVVLVTGAASGMGLACARRAAREDGAVVLCDVNADAAAEAAATISATGAKAIGIGGDITRREDCDRTVAAAVEAYGSLDVAINSAGVMDGGNDGRPAPMHLASDTYLRRTVEINVLGTMMACAAELQQMVAQGRGGSIVNVGSTTGLTGSAGTPAYVASKHAVNGLTRSIAIDYAPHGIRCNSANMGATETPMLSRAMDLLSSRKDTRQPLKAGPMIKPGPLIDRPSSVWEQAAVILFLASREASYMTGALVASDGGWTAY